MNNSTMWAIVIVLVVLGTAGFIWQRNESVNIAESPVANVRGCFVARTDKDVYTLIIRTLTEDGDVTGTLAFKNFEKDSSSGTFTGTFDDGILLGDYAFRSEGTDSVMQVIFKKVEAGFVRGHGDVDPGGTRFTDLGKITYDESSALSLFRKEPCALEEV